jgi:hypothetical protein
MTVTWVRSPTWDGVWILSGLPLGLAASFAPIGLTLTAFFILNSAHLISPLIVAWGHKELSRVAQTRWVRFITVPALVLITTTLLGLTVTRQFPVTPLATGIKITSMSDYTYPFVWLFPIYFLWNAYHFGMQNFGIAHIYLRTRRQQALKWGCLAGTVTGMIIIPRWLHVSQVSLFMLGFFSFNHSLAAIGLSSHVLGNRLRCSPWAVALTLVFIGTGVFWVMFGVPWAPVVTMAAVGFRIGLGFVHFLYDRWIWRLSDPAVRSTIGRDLFCLGTDREFRD